MGAFIEYTSVCENKLFTRKKREVTIDPIENATMKNGISNLNSFDVLKTIFLITIPNNVPEKPKIINGIL